MKTLLLALLLGLGVSVSAVVPWRLFAGVNLRTSPGLPWSVPLIALYLSFLIAYLNGRWWPATTSASRRRLLRPRWLSPKEWVWALTAGTAGVLALWALYFALGGFSGARPAKGAAMPMWVLVLATCVSAAVTAFGEEAGFRGYMQGMLESRFKLAPTLLIVSLVFTLTHLSHGLSALARNGAFYFTASCIYCLQAHLTKSILPSLVLHFAGDLFLFAMLSAVIHVVLPHNVMASVALVGLAVILALSSVAAFRRLACLKAMSSG